MDQSVDARKLQGFVELLSLVHISEIEEGPTGVFAPNYILAHWVRDLRGRSGQFGGVMRPLGYSLAGQRARPWGGNRRRPFHHWGRNGAPFLRITNRSRNLPSPHICEVVFEVQETIDKDEAPVGDPRAIVGMCRPGVVRDCGAVVFRPL